MSWTNSSEVCEPALSAKVYPAMAGNWSTQGTTILITTKSILCVQSFRHKMQGKTCSQGSTTTNSHEYQHHVCVSWFGSILKQQPSPLRLSSIWGIWPLVAWTNWVEIDSLRASKHSEQKSSRRWWPSPHINEKHQSIQACVSLCSHSAPENGNGGLLETNFLLETTTSRCYCWWFRNPAPLDMVNIPLFTGL